jgi:hypothetical protein
VTYFAVHRETHGMPVRVIARAKLSRHLLKADEVLSQRRREMQAALEPHVEHRYAAFA